MISGLRMERFADIEARSLIMIMRGNNIEKPLHYESLRSTVSRSHDMQQFISVEDVWKM